VGEGASLTASSFLPVEVADLQTESSTWEGVSDRLKAEFCREWPHEVKAGAIREIGKLPPKVQRFLLHYLETGNGSESARRAGYSPKGAEVRAHELLNRPDVKRALNVIAVALGNEVEARIVRHEKLARAMSAIALDPSIPARDRISASKAVATSDALLTTLTAPRVEIQAGRGGGSLPDDDFSQVPDALAEVDIEAYFSLASKIYGDPFQSEAYKRWFFARGCRWISKFWEQCRKLEEAGQGAGAGDGEGLADSAPDDTQARDDEGASSARASG
jgi:phage terminase small subunit